MAALPDAALAWAFFAASSARLDPEWAERLHRAALIEFFAVHAGGFLLLVYAFEWPVRRRLALLGGVAAFYSLATGGISLIARAAWPLATFWALAANRLLGALAVTVARERPDGHDRFHDQVGLPWAGATTLFVVAASAVGLAGASRAAVLWGGGFYFGAIAVSELTGWRWADRWMRRGRR